MISLQQSNEPFPWIEEFRKQGYKMIDLICDYFKELATKPVQPLIQPGQIISKLPKEAPKDSESWEKIFEDTKNIILPGLTNWQHPNFYAYFPATTSYPSVLADMFTAPLSSNGMMWITSPAVTEVEMVVMDWLGKILELPKEFLFEGGGGGVIQGTASEAVVVCLIAARKRAINYYLQTLENSPKQFSSNEEETKFISKLVAYTSDQAHSCITKAFFITGIPISQLRIISTNEDFSFSVTELEANIKGDKAKGLIPFFVASTVGTTGSTAVDPITEIGKICQREGIWHHIDSAYAGSACICPEYRHYLNGVEYADSFTMNPHKWLLVSFDFSALWLKDPQTLTSALSITPSYLKNKASDSGSIVDYRDWQIPLGRRFRSLKLWYVLRHYGIKGLQEHIRADCKAAEQLEEWISKDSNFEIVVKRKFSLVVFRLKASDQVNKEFVQKLNDSGKLLLTSAQLKGKSVIRWSIGGTHVNNSYKFLEETWKYFKEQAALTLENTK